MKANIIFIFLLLYLSNELFSQNIPDDLARRLHGKTNLSEIMQVVNNYYDFGRLQTEQVRTSGEQNENADVESPYLFWKRFEYYWRSRLDENGNVGSNVSKKILEGYANYVQSRTTNSAQSPLSSYGFWNPFGPSVITHYGQGYASGYGRVNCIAFHPTDPSTLYIGLPQGGIWKTVDNGSNWFPLTDQIPSTGVGGIVVDHANPNFIYVLTGDGDGSTGGFVVNYGYAQSSVGVLKSTDAGNSWQKTGDFPGAGSTYYGYKLIQHPSNTNILFAATSSGIYKTTDAGLTWTQVKFGNFTDIEFKPGSPTTMYASSIPGTFYRSTDTGDTWSNAGLTGLPSGANRLNIGVSSNNSNYVYLLAGPVTASGIFKGVYRSTNSGVDFTTQTTTPNILGRANLGNDAVDQSIYDLAFEVAPSNASVVLTGGVNIWKSTNNGSTFTYRTAWQNDQAANYIHADIHSLAYNHLNGYLYSCSDGGVGFSTDDGETWTFISSGLQTQDVYHADWLESNADVIITGNQDNGTTIKTSSSTSYTNIYGGDGFDCLIDPADVNTLWFVSNNTIHKTTNGGFSQTDISPAGLLYFPNLARDFNNNNKIYAADASSFYSSTNGGTTWTTTGIAGGIALTTCPSNSSRIYVSDGTNTRRTDDAGSTFTSINGTTGYPLNSSLTDIACQQSNSLVIIASFGGYNIGKKIYSSTNGGASWTNISGSLPNVAFHSVVFDGNNTMYAGSDIGVFVKSASMSDWQPFYNNLPKTPVSQLMVNNTAGKIYACTFGRGTYISDLYSTCTPSLVLNGNLYGNKFYEAGDFITATVSVNTGAGNNVAMKATNLVHLFPGFIAGNNSTFHAYIDPCGVGGVPNKPVQTFTESVPVKYIPASGKSVFPYAHIVSVNARTRKVVLQVDAPGRYTIRLTDKDGNYISIQKSEAILLPGKHEFALTSTQSGFYYLQLFKDKQLIHFQEWEITP